jgi:hypothetical protein
MKTKMFNRFFVAGLTARWPWTHFRIHREPQDVHLVWGKLSVQFAKTDPDAEMIRVCCACHGAIEVVSAGDESWDVCEGCGQIEGNTVEITLDEYEANSN